MKEKLSFLQKKWFLGHLARGANPFDAASAASFVNGKAGELCAKDFGESMLATDLLHYVSKAIKL